MKEYASIPSWKKAVQGLPCLAFYKYDGSCIRSQYDRKKGWVKFGTRSRLLDKTDPDFGDAITVFEKTMAEPLAKILHDHPDFRGMESAVAYFEYFGENSFAGVHDPNDEKQLVLIDVNIHKRGLVLPRSFIKIFTGIPVAQVVYEGNFNAQFIEDIKNSTYKVEEGIVAKGIKPNFKKEQHGLWFAKVKTKKWLDKLKALALINPALQSVLSENLVEQ